MSVNQDAIEEIPATGEHTWETTELALAATCTTAGKKAVEKCAVCGLERGGEEVAALGHAWGEAIVIAEPTCGVTGRKAPQCLRCMTLNQDAIEEIPATGEHTWETVEPALMPTCTMAGKKAVEKCPVCGQERGGEEVAALGHAWETEEVIAEATCTQEGKAKERCTRCGTAEEHTVEKLPHTLTATAAKAATLADTGNLAYWTCSVCGKVFSDATGTKETTVQAMQLPRLTPTPAPIYIEEPVITATPTARPTARPTAVPTATPTAAPTAEPTAEPTEEPAAEPVPVVVETVLREETAAVLAASSEEMVQTVEALLLVQNYAEPAAEEAEEEAAEPAPVQLIDTVKSIAAIFEPAVEETVEKPKASVAVQGIDVFLREEEKDQLAALPVQDQLLISLSVMGLDDLIQTAMEGDEALVSEEGKQLLQSV